MTAETWCVQFAFVSCMTASNYHDWLTVSSFCKVWWDARTRKGDNSKKKHLCDSYHVIVYDARILRNDIVSIYRQASVTSRKKPSRLVIKSAAIFFDRRRSISGYNRREFAYETGVIFVVVPTYWFLNLNRHSQFIFSLRRKDGITLAWLVIFSRWLRKLETDFNTVLTVYYFN